MGASQPLLHSARSISIPRFASRLALALIGMFGGAPLLPTAYAQTPQVSLVTLATDQTPLNLSNHFGAPNAAVVNQNGDYAFVGEGYGEIGGHGEGSALFLRLHGAALATRLLQFGDPVPGLTGATAVEFNVGGLNSSAHLLFRVDYTVSPPDGRLHRAFMIYNGTTYSMLVSSDTVAAGSGGQQFGQDLACLNTNCLDDNGDVLLQTDFEPFAGTDTVPNQNTFYIVPAGGTPVRVVGLGDSVPGVSGATFISLNATSQINALGQFLFAAQGFNGTTTVSGLFLGSVSGGVGIVTKVVATGDAKPGGGTFSPSTNFVIDSGELNDNGQVAFVNPVAPESVWFYSAGVITNTYPGTAGNSILLSGLSNLGSAVGTFTTSSGQSVVRIHSNGTVDTVASPGQPAPGVNGATFAGFFNTSLIDNNDRVVFATFFNVGGIGIYQQTGTGASQPIVLGGQSSALSGGGTISAAQALKALDNGSTYFSADISGGTANLAQYLGTPGNLAALMSTADTLPAGGRVRLYLPLSNSGNNNNNDLFVAFAANLAGGQTALFVKDIIAGTTTRIVSEGDVIPGFNGATFVQRSGLFYMNGSGQVVFLANLSTGGQAVLLAGPGANSVTTAAAIGSIVSVSGAPGLTSVNLSNNTTALSPINDSSQVAFYGTLTTGANGIFLYDGGSNIFEIAVTGETVPEGGATFTNLNSNCSPTCSLGLNQNGQVAFGALKSGGGSGLYVGSAFGPPTKVVASGDFLPGSSTVTFGPLNPISGFNSSGQVVFGSFNGGGVYLGSGGSTPVAAATDGTANPGTGGGVLATSTPAFSVTGLNNFFTTTNAAINDSGSIAFQSRVTGTGATTNSAYFRVSNNGGTLGSLQATGAYQGQSVTGAGTLGTMFPSFLNNTFFSLQENGSGSGGSNFAFTNSFTNASNVTMVGQFFTFGGSFVEKIMVPGDAILGTGGAVYSLGSLRAQNQQNGVPVYSVLTAGGNASHAIVLVAIEGGTVTTQTTLVSALNPTGAGFPAQFTAAVTSAQGPPPAGDIVAFFDGGVEIGAGTTDATGAVTFITSSLGVGSHSITAEYFPSNSSVGFVTSTSNVVTQVVSNATSAFLFSTPNPSAPGQSVFFEVAVTPLEASISVPTGTVNFLDGATQIGTGTLSGEIATFSTSSLSTGSHSITAVYGGDANFTGSTSTPVTQVVQTSSGSGPGPSATALASSVNPSFAGQLVTFTAPVHGAGGGSPTGNVAFMDGTVQIGTGTINTGTGLATFSTSSLSPGFHPVTAVYSGDANFLGSTSNVVTQIVTVLTSSAVKFVYAANQNSNDVSAYTVNSATGALTLVPGSPFATGGIGATSVAMDPSGRFVYVTSNCNSGCSSGTVSVFSVDATSGGLTPAPGSPFTTGGQFANSVSADPSGRFIYVVNANSSTIPGSVSVFSVNATTGALTPVAGSPFTTGAFESYSVNADPQGRFVYATNVDNSAGNPGSLSVFSVNAATGVLTPVAGSPFATGALYPVSVSADPSGRFVYVADECSSACSGTVSVLSVNGATGALTAVAGSPFVTGTFANSVSADPSGRFVYVTNQCAINIPCTANGSVVVFSVNSTTGALTAVAGSPFATGGTAAYLLGADPSGRFVYAADDGTNNVSALSVDATTGALTPVTGSPFASGGTGTYSVAAFGVPWNPNATLVSLAVQPGTATVGVGGKQQFTAVGTYSDGSTRFLTASVIWLTSDGTIATISNASGNSGLATGVAQGSVDISASINGVTSPTVSLTVNAAPAITSGNTATFTEGTLGTFIVTATGTPTPALSETGSLPSNVTFTDNGDGTATLTGTPGAGTTGSYSISITAQNGFGTNATQNLTLIVNAPPAITSANTATFTVGALGTFTVTVTGAPTPTLAETGAFPTGVTFNAGALSGTPAAGTAGTYPITITAHNGVGSDATQSFTLTVGTLSPLATSTALSSSSDPSFVGQGVTFTATVSATVGGTPTGNVNFLDNGVQTGVGTLGASIPGVATFITSSLSLGSHPITVQYTGDANFANSTSNLVTQTVNLYPTSAVLVSSINPSAVGQVVTFNASVSGPVGAPGIPTGNVNFLDSGVQIGTGTLNASGMATFATTTLSLGAHSITAQYTGNATFAASASTAMSQQVNANPTSTTVISSLNPSAFGQPVSFTAIVTNSAGGTPTGNVTFLDNGVQMGVGALNGNGIATFSTSSLSGGGHPVTARYAGDANFGASTSIVLTQNVTSYPTTTNLISSLNPSIGSQSVTFTVIVTSSGGGTPAGSVTFSDNTADAQIGTGTLNGNGVATFATSLLTAGSHSITAQFNGNANFVGSTSAALTQTVTINPTSTVLVSSLNPSLSTQFVQFTAIVSSSTGATPTGSVNFFDGATQIGAGTLNPIGQATFGISSLGIASHSITAQYLGNSSFAGSTSAAVNQSVMINPTPATAPTFVAIASSPNPSAVGQSVLINATVSSNSTSATPTGHITFFDNGTPISGGVIQLASGSVVATFSTSALTAGSHSLTAQYSGDANFALSLSAVLSQTVGSGTQQVSVQITPIPTNVAPRSTCPSGGYCQQFGATVQNGGSNPTVAWQVLSGPGSIDSTGNFTAGPSVTQGPVTISASVTGSSASISFTLGPDALTTTQPPATVAAGTPLSVPVQLSGVPASSTVPFTLSCGSLPASTTCQFSNTSAIPAGCPMGTITFVTGACPNFTVTLLTTGSSSAHLAPRPLELDRPWYGLFALMLSALAWTGRRRGVFFGRRSYACCVLALLCISVLFVASCSVIPTTSTVAPPSAVPATPAGSYQAVVLATPPSGAPGGFVQTQLIVPLVVK